jgi:hypothetical protein
MVHLARHRRRPVVRTGISGGSMQPFMLTAESLLGREETRTWAVGILARDLAYAKYHLAAQTKREVVFVQTTRAVGTWLLTILLFPLGLVFFFAFKRTSTITVLLQKAANGTNIVVSGEAKPRVIEGIGHRLALDFDALDDADDAEDTDDRVS